MRECGGVGGGTGGGRSRRRPAESGCVTSGVGAEEMGTTAGQGVERCGQVRFGEQNRTEGLVSAALTPPNRPLTLWKVPLHSPWGVRRVRHS